MPTPHIGAEPGEIAETVLVPGCPLRAKYIADNFLDDTKCYTSVRNMLGFTGYVKHGIRRGERVSVQGGGMGMASNAIYYTELAKYFGVKRVIRVGTCGGINEKVKLNDVIVATAAVTESNIVELLADGRHFPLVPDSRLFSSAVATAKSLKIPVLQGTIISTDIFYDKEDWWKKPQAEGVLAVEMESAVLFALGALYGFQAASILTVSDLVPTNEHLPSEAREKAMPRMAEVALRM